ncbi:hypothetical protein ACIBCA_03165 [Kitasatospora sp. NPDC051170]|uniref:hypothetical protein n=1 Tax=Kitasatospora sp. NPDC051170 TaxID=3364056 RepID=UPI0037A31CFA
MRSCYLLDPASPSLPGLLGRARTAGLDSVVAKLGAVTPALLDQVRRHGLRLYGSFACFRGPDGPRAVDQDGQDWQPMEWYTGVRPNDPAWNARLAARLGAALRALPPDAPLDGLLLDFLRWPLHWEVELRPGARPRSASYDEATLRQFAERTGLHPPGGGARAARWIAERHAPEWTAYRTGAVTDAARLLAGTARRARPGLAVGAFLVPADGEAGRRTLVGQDSRQLAEFLDLLLPMTYHAILHRDPGWPARLTRGLISTAATATVVPVVQTTADAAVLPPAPGPSAPGPSAPGPSADWGPPIDDSAFTALLDSTLDAGSGSICLFPAEGLGPGRWTLLCERLAHHRPPHHRPPHHPLEGPRRAR